MSGVIVKVSGLAVVASDMPGAKMGDKVYLGTQRIVGELMHLTRDTVWILAYEDISTLKAGDMVECANTPLDAELGPGLLGGFYDGLGRSYPALYTQTGDMIPPGTEAQTLDHTKRWAFKPSVTVGTKVQAGDAIGTVQETEMLTHKILVPHGMSGTVAEVHSGERTVEETIVIVKASDGTNHKLSMTHPWPIRTLRLYKQRHLPEVPIKTGIAELDQDFPLLRGSTGLFIGEDGIGQAAFKHLTANCAEIDVMVYAGCGISGSESAALFETYAKASTPKTVLLTSPPDGTAAQREAIVHRGLTIASYYRDIGLNAMLVIDNLCAWLGAAGVTSGLMGQAAYEGGPPLNLSARLAELFAPAGLVTCLGTEKRQGSITILGVLPSVEEPHPILLPLIRLVRTVWVAEDGDFSKIDTSASFSRDVEAQGGKADV